MGELVPPARKENKETAPTQPVAASVGQADLNKQIQALGDEIRVLKEKLKAEGLTGKELNNHESVKSLVGQLQALKNQEKAAPAAAPVSVPSSTPVSAPPATAVNSNIDDQVKAVGDQLRELKEKLKGEGLTGKKLNEHESVKALVVQLQELKSQQKAGAAQGAGPAVDQAVARPTEPATASAAVPAAVPGDSLEDRIKAVGDELRALKEKLKGEGLTGKKLNDHESVKTLVAELQELKNKHKAGAGQQNPAPAAATSVAQEAVPEVAPAVEPAVVPAADVDAQLKAVADELRMLKEKLKSEGFTGKKLNDHAEVKVLVAQLLELKGKLKA